ncbi:MAG TPA: transglycosylase SLT domain-containing protein, partial [Candidatus Eisenbacteria bacterium]
LQQVRAPESAEIGLRLGEVLRAARRFGDAERALGHAERGAERPLRARIALERARVARDAGHVDRAGTWFGKAASLATEPPVRELAFWERARDLEQRGAWTRARADYAQVAALGLGRAQDAAVRTGLLWLVEGEADSARAAWARGGGEAAEFWSAVSWRSSQRERADSLLDLIARRPGYSFYRAAARDTLARSGRPSELAPAAAPDTLGDETLALVRDLIAAGEAADGAALLQRWSSGDPRLSSSGRALPQRPAPLLVASRLAYAAGRPALGIQIARRAVEAVPDSSVSERWALVPWAYPPAYDSLVSARADTGARAVIDRTLLLALIWQESKFDAAARSRSNAIGLMQLKPSVANRMARLRREYPPPGEVGLMDPAINLKYGTRLLDQLRMSFGGKVTLMLAAYNAGPASASRWRRPEAVGGDALEAELFEYAETQDYVKSILGARQAYRELAPHAVTPSR